MSFLKIISVILFFVFIFINGKFYLSENFIKTKELNRLKYNLYLKKYNSDLPVIESKKNYKEFIDNSDYFKKETEEKSFWELLRK